MATSGANSLAGTYYGGVFLSSDNGTNWSAFDIGSEHVAINTFAVSGTNIFVGTNGRGIFLSTNNGASWRPVSTGSVWNYEITALAVADTYVYAGIMGTGVWKRPISEMITGAEEEHSVLPHGFWLEQNYPNPFNPSTTIKFQIPKSSFITLKVFDLLGREVVTLVNEEMTPGSYNRRFDGSGLASGVYQYRLQAGSYTQTRKLILQK